MVPVDEGHPLGVVQAGHEAEAVDGLPSERRHGEARGGFEDQPLGAVVQHLKMASDDEKRTRRSYIMLYI